MGHLHHVSHEGDRRRRLTSDSQFHPDFTPGLGGIILKSLQQGHNFCIVVPLCPANGIRLADIPWFPEIHLPSRRNPPLDDVKVTTGSSTPEWSAPITIGPVHSHPGIFQHLTNTGGASTASQIKGCLSNEALHVDIYVRMCQSTGITGDLLSLKQAWCNKVHPFPSTAIFTLKPGSCLISSANSFESPFSTAASTMNPRKDQKRNPVVYP